ncbi:hypothetical protein MIMGU_mgv1a0106321mg, partial [Erythranthe guttata]
MAEKDDGLGLSLSLGCPDNNQIQNHHPSPAATPPPPPTAATRFPLNFFRSPLPFMQQHVSSSSDAFHPSSTDRNAEARSSLFRGIDMNIRAVSVIDCDEEVMVSSPNSTVSSLSGKRSEREDNDGESLDLDDDGGDGGDAAARKKLRLSKEQAAVLEETFKEHNTLNPKQKMALAKQLNLRARQVEVWFQNRRA